MYNIPSNTLFLGKRIIYVPECHSTNDIAAEMMQQPAVHEGTVIITNHQLSGRGQKGASWLTEPGKNLTFSLILNPVFLEPRNQFYLNVCIALSVRDFIADKVNKPATPVRIKWPNDITTVNKKACGILIENQLHGDKFVSSIVGIGLNVNQQNFPFSTATSLNLLTGKDYSLDEMLQQLLTRIEARYLQLRQQKFDELYQDYLRVMYWLNEPHAFQARGELFNGVIKGVDQYGRLHIQENGTSRFFAVKEVEYVR